MKRSIERSIVCLILLLVIQVEQSYQSGCKDNGSMCSRYKHHCKSKPHFREKCKKTCNNCPQEATTAGPTPAPTSAPTEASTEAPTTAHTEAECRDNANPTYCGNAKKLCKENQRIREVICRKTCNVCPQADIDDCLSNPCQNGATCHDLVKSFSCDCVPGYVGETCEVDVDDCLLSPCQNGATCHDQVNAYSCECVPGYVGETCENKATTAAPTSAPTEAPTEAPTTAPSTTAPNTPTTPETGECQNKNSRCPEMPKYGRQVFCQRPWARRNCQHFCGICGDEPFVEKLSCYDIESKCSVMGFNYDKFCARPWARRHCRKFCGVCVSETPSPA